MTYPAIYRGTPQPTDDTSNLVCVTPTPLADGSTLWHAPQDTPAPSWGTAVMDGSTPWTWGQFATARPDLAPFVMPQEFAGNDQGIDANATNFPLLYRAPDVSVVATKSLWSRLTGA